MTEPMAADDVCEHHYETRILGGHPIHVTACTFCRTPDWADLDEQADELYRWGWQEGRAREPRRATLSAYDKPREATEVAPRTTPDNPATSSDAADNSLREQYAAAISELPYYERDDADSIADAVLPITQSALREQRDRQVTQSVALVQRNADLQITLRQALDAFEAYWARASYDGPGETAVQPEHLQAWRATLDGKEQQ